MMVVVKDIKSKGKTHKRELESENKNNQLIFVWFEYNESKFLDPIFKNNLLKNSKVVQNLENDFIE